MYCHEYDKTNLESSCFLQCYVKRLEITKILYLVCSKIEFLFVSSCNPRKKKSTQGKNLRMGAIEAASYLLKLWDCDL